jgi:hypothetical protein
MTPDMRKSIAFLKVPKLRPLVLLIREFLRLRLIWNIDGIIKIRGD